MNGLWQGALVIVFGIWPLAAILTVIAFRVLDAGWALLPALAAILVPTLIGSLALTAAVQAIFGA